MKVLNALTLLIFLSVYTPQYQVFGAPTIVLVTFIYTEKVPPLYDLFLLSAWKNPTIQFRVVSDMNALELPFNVARNRSGPSNVKIIHTPWNDVNTALSKHLNISFKLNASDAYKLCDFKPMIAHVFPDVVKGFDFWGHVDNDVVFGDLRDVNFLSDGLLKYADIISSSNSMCNGPLQLYRNIAKINSLYLASPDFKVVSATTKYWVSLH